jgi:hypothetical protein
MANIDRIVSVNIALNTAGISKEGFSTRLIVGESTNALARVSSYTSSVQMTDDGYSETDPLYLMAADFFSQIPHPNVLKVGRRQVDEVAVTVENVLAEGGTYTLTVTSADATNTYTYTVASGDGSAEILGGLATAMATDPTVTAVYADAALTLTNRATGTAFMVKVDKNLTKTNGASSETIAETMAACVAYDPDFYGIAMTSRADADILAMANWAEANNKLFGTCVSGSDVLDGSDNTDIASQLMLNNFYRTFSFYHEDTADFPEVAVMSRCFTAVPGSETWANKRLAGVKVDPLTETQFIVLRNKNVNTFEKFRNLSLTQTGKVAAGEWIDVIRFRDWLAEEIKVNVLNVLVNNEKVPYTDAGIAIIEGAIRQSLRQGQVNGGIAPVEYDEEGNKNLGYTVTVPLAANISANQKASRILTDVKFTARLAGAIHVVEITGSLTYENLLVGGN